MGMDADLQGAVALLTSVGHTMTPGTGSQPGGAQKPS